MSNFDGERKKEEGRIKRKQEKERQRKRKKENEKSNEVSIEGLYLKNCRHFLYSTPNRQNSVERAPKDL